MDSLWTPYGRHVPAGGGGFLADQEYNNYTIKEVIKKGND
jgi:hypothetical protein